MTAKRPMANCVGASMNPMQLMSFEPTLNRAPSQPQIQQLPARHHTVLPLRQLSYPAIGRVRRLFSMIERGNGRSSAHAADGRRLRRTYGAHPVSIQQRARFKKRLQPAGTASGFDPLK
jgi:hypothetical protein